MSKAIKIIAHHGSPGTAQDFNHLEQSLKDCSFQKLSRFPWQDNINADESIQLGYSWGCSRAIIEAAKNPEKTKALILIAPYLFVSKKVSFPMKALLNAPILSSVLLKKIAPKKIEEMLIDSSFPQEVPENYKSDSKPYSTAKVLRHALLEKDLDPGVLTASLEKIKSSKIPVYVLRGDEDKTTNKDEQAQTLKRLINFEEIVFQKAGHALLWTHTNELATNIKALLNKNEGKKTMDQKFGYQEGSHHLNNVCSFLNKHLDEVPNRPILSWVSPENLKKWSFNLNDPLPHDSVSVQELEHLVATIGAGFKSLGIEKGDRVIVFVPMSLYLYSAMFALQKIGAIAVFLDSWARRDQLGVSADVVSPKAMVSVEQAYEYMADVEQIQNIPIKVSVGPTTKEYTARLEALMQTPTRTETEPVEKEHTALITFTTGSSGTPKGADRTHRFLAAQHYALNRHLPYQSTDADLPVFPIFSLNNLAAGVKTVIPAIDVGVPSDKDALILIAQMKSTDTTCTTLSPSLLNAVSAYCIENNVQLPFLRRIITGGAPVSRDDLIRITSVCPNAEVLVLYGSTEVEPMAHIEAKEMINQKSSTDPEWVDEGVNVGKFDSGLEVKYLKIEKGPIVVNSNEDWKKLEVQNGKVGEIIVAGEHVCENYYNNTEAFSRAKIRDERGVVWHRTGDLGRVDENGDLWLVGRVHNAINRADEYVFPVRAEIIMKKLPFVHRAAYLGMADEKLGEKTVCVFTTEESEVDESAWKDEIKRLMDKNGVPVDAIVFTENIPMDPRHHSKVEYGVLRESLKEQGL